MNKRTDSILSGIDRFHNSLYFQEPIFSHGTTAAKWHPGSGPSSLVDVRQPTWCIGWCQSPVLSSSVTPSPWSGPCWRLKTKSQLQSTLCFLSYCEKINSQSTCVLFLVDYLPYLVGCAGAGGPGPRAKVLLEASDQPPLLLPLYVLHEQQGKPCGWWCSWTHDPDHHQSFQSIHCHSLPHSVSRQPTMHWEASSCRAGDPEEATSGWAETSGPR